MTVTDAVRVTSEICFALFCMLSIRIAAMRRLTRRKSDLYMIVCLTASTAYLIGDIMAVIGRGNVSLTGILLTRVGNFVYYFAGILIIYSITEYVGNSLIERNAGDKTGLHLQVNRLLVIVALLLLLASSFIGFIYEYDDQNRYYREKYFWTIAATAILDILNLLILTFRNRKALRKFKKGEFFVYCTVPAAAYILQTLHYGSFIINLTVAGMVLLFVILTMIDQNREFHETEKELQEVKTDLMVSQIQPHFIFNSLTAIQSLITENPAAAYEAIGDFSEFIRGVLDAVKYNSVVNVEEDLNTARGYFKIEKLRFGDELNIVTEINDTNFSVPMLTIQPILENAVRHGVRKSGRAGTITLSLNDTGYEHVIEISDDGAGFDMAKTDIDGAEHLGISNVRARIERMCGGSMEIVSSPGNGTSVKMFFPKGADKDGNKDTAA